MKYKSSGFEVFDHEPSDETKAPKDGYCTRCFHSYWRKEVVVRSGLGYVHRDCMVALADRSPRKMNPGVASIIGEVDKGLLKQKVKKAILRNQS